jgi:hypothetical protein
MAQDTTAQESRNDAQREMTALRETTAMSETIEQETTAQ